MHAIHTWPPYLSFYLCLGFPSGLLPPGFPTKILNAFLTYPMHAICLDLILLDLITLIIYVEAYKL